MVGWKRFYVFNVFYFVNVFFYFENIIENSIKKFESTFETTETN